MPFTNTTWDSGPSDSILCTKKDIERIDRLFMEHDDFWEAIRGENTPDSWRRHLGRRLIRSENTYLFTPNESSLFIVRLLLGEIVYECHSFILPQGRGEAGIQACRRAIQWMFRRTNCKKLVGFTPAPYRAARMFALQVGFKQEGVMKKSFERNGILYDRIIFGLSKGEESWAM